MGIIINPGSGPVSGASEREARMALDSLLADLGAEWSADAGDGRDEGEGRWTYVIRHGGHPHKVEMPGLPVERVRYTGEDGQDIWDYPRLYVDGSSWVWRYALNVLRECGPSEGKS